jgi:hypothetical protein
VDVSCGSITERHVDTSCGSITERHVDISSIAMKMEVTRCLETSVLPHCKAEHKHSEDRHLRNITHRNIITMYGHINNKARYVLALLRATR